jgi:hypothetical protein
VALGLIFGLIGAPRVTPISQTTYPGQRLLLSIKNFLLAFLLFGPGLSLFITVILSQRFELIYLWFTTFPLTHMKEMLMGVLGVITEEWLSVVIFWLIFGLNLGLKYGGYSVIKHYTLRFIMIWNNFIPKQLVPFLDYCCDLIFLRRVGGGYIFVHRLLMEHFADMYQEQQ